MTVTKRDKLEYEQYCLEVELEFWQDQQQKTKDEMYWHYAEGRIQALNEKIDQIRRKLEEAMW